jgi:hypothetical protein
MPSSKERYRSARSARMRELTGEPGYQRNRLLAAIPGIVIGVILIAVLRSIGVGAGVAVVLGVAGPLLYWYSKYHRASSEAKESVMTAWASEHGWTHSDELDPPGDIAFCRNRQKARATDGFAGPMCGLDGLIFNFTYSTWETRTRTVTDANGNMRTETYQQEVKHYHTVLRLALGVIPGIPTMQLSEKRFGLFDKLVAAFGPSRVEETESSEFNDRFRLLVADSADEIAVKRVFTPALIVRVVQNEFPQTTFQLEDSGLSFIWEDQYNVEELEEVEQRVADVTPLSEALQKAVAPLQAPAQTASNP